MDQRNHYSKNTIKTLKTILQKSIITPVVLTGLMMLFSCENDVEVVKSITLDSDHPQLSAKNSEIIYTDSTYLEMRITAPKLERYVKSENNKYFEFPEGINVYFYDEEEIIESEIKANYAIYYEDEELWEARNNVVAKNKNGEVLKTELLFWDDGKDKIYTDEFAKITDKESEIQGEGFEAHENMTNWEFKKVTGIINLEDQNAEEK